MGKIFFARMDGYYSGWVIFGNWFTKKVWIFEWGNFLGKLRLSRRNGCLRMDGCLGGVIFGKKIFEEWMDVWVGT